MKRIVNLLFPVLLIACMLAFTFPQMTQAQKKKKDSPPPVQPAASEQPSRVPAQTGSTIRELLTKLQGQQTNLGTLVRVAGELVEFENEADTLIYPLNAVQVVKFLKAEEGEARKVEIRFLARD